MAWALTFVPGREVAATRPAPMGRKEGSVRETLPRLWTPDQLRPHRILHSHTAVASPPLRAGGSRASECSLSSTPVTPNTCLSSLQLSAMAPRLVTSSPSSSSLFHTTTYEKVLQHSLFQREKGSWPPPSLPRPPSTAIRRGANTRRTATSPLPEK